MLLLFLFIISNPPAMHCWEDEGSIFSTISSEVLTLFRFFPPAKNLFLSWASQFHCRWSVYFWVEQGTDFPSPIDCAPLNTVLYVGGLYFCMFCYPMWRSQHWIIDFHKLGCFLHWVQVYMWWQLCCPFSPQFPELWSMNVIQPGKLVIFTTANNNALKRNS